MFIRESQRSGLWSLLTFLLITLRKDQTKGWQAFTQWHEVERDQKHQGKLKDNAKESGETRHLGQKYPSAVKNLGPGQIESFISADAYKL